MDSLPHRLLLIELDPTTGLSGISNLGLRWYALAGAILAELQLQDRLVAGSADVFGFAGQELLEGALGRAEAPLRRNRRPQTMEALIRQLYQRSFRTRRDYLSELLHAGALAAEADPVLPWRTRWRPTEVRDERIGELRTWMSSVRPEDPPEREDLLLSLLRCTQLLDRVWSGIELAHLGARIEHRTERAPIGQLVHDMAYSGYDTRRPRSFGPFG